MLATIEPGNIVGSITAPSSKSYTQRAFAAALLHEGITVVTNPGKSRDELSALEIIRQAGCTVIEFEDKVEIISTGKPNACALYNCGESGLAARMFLPILAGSAPLVTLTGDSSLRDRKIGDVQHAMQQLGIGIPGFTGALPLSMTGAFTPQDLEIDAGDSSQLLTGLLFALSAGAKKTVRILVNNLSSKPYVDMTLDVLRRSGRPVTNIGYREFIVEPKEYDIPEILRFHVEGDWSSASFFLVAGAIAGTMTVENLQIDSTQADKIILNVLQDAGAKVDTTGNSVSVQRSALNAFEFDATDCPDLFPILAILGACCNGESSITGLHRLFFKESNRAESIGEMLLRFNIPFTMEADTLYVTGRSGLGCYGQIDTYLDHRIEMAAAIGALRARGQVQIRSAGTHTKSYPAFWKDLNRCGVRVRLD